MKIKELKEIIKNMDNEKEVTVFAGGDIYKIWEVKYLFNDESLDVEIGCGWEPVVYDENKLNF